MYHDVQGRLHSRLLCRCWHQLQYFQLLYDSSLLWRSDICIRIRESMRKRRDRLQCYRVCRRSTCLLHEHTGWNLAGERVALRPRRCLPGAALHLPGQHGVLWLRRRLLLSMRLHLRNRRRNYWNVCQHWGHGVLSQSSRSGNLLLGPDRSVHRRSAPQLFVDSCRLQLLRGLLRDRPYRDQRLPGQLRPAVRGGLPGRRLLLGRASHRVRQLLHRRLLRRHRLRREARVALRLCERVHGDWPGLLGGDMR